MSHFRQTQHGWEIIPVEETKEYQIFQKAMSRPGLVGGYLAQTVEPFITVYLPDLQEGDNFPPFLQRLLGVVNLPEEITTDHNHWKYIGYRERPLPDGAEALRRVETNSIKQVNGTIEAQILPTQQPHAFVPQGNTNKSDAKAGVIYTDREKYYDCGNASFVGWELVPLTEELYESEYAETFKEGQLFCFGRDPQLWEIKRIEWPVPSDDPSSPGLFHFTKATNKNGMI